MMETENNPGSFKDFIRSFFYGSRSDLSFKFMAEMDKPLSALKLSLLTSSGHFLKGCDPNPLGMENMTQKQAEDRVFDFLKQVPELSEISFDTAPEDLIVRHGGYDIRGAQKDPNVCFPLLETADRNGMVIDYDDGK